MKAWITLSAIDLYEYVHEHISGNRKMREMKYSINIWISDMLSFAGL